MEDKESKTKKRWLALEHFFFKHKPIFWMILWFLFFFVMPFFNYEQVDVMDLP